MIGLARRIGIWLCMGLIAATAAQAQQSSYPVFQPVVPVVSVNREALLQKSQYGQALMGVLTRRQSALVEENEALSAKLEQEELELTELRKTLTPEEFNPLAEVFDNKVKEVRRTQDQKSVDLAKALETSRFRFFRHAEAVIGQLMSENGIVFVLDESAVWLSKGGDVTQAVIDRLDAAYAAGELPVE